MKNKRGILMSETVRLVLAVICVVILIYLSVSLYGIMIGKHKLEQARATLRDITGKMDSFKEGDGSYDYLITSPKDWALISFPSENKICICPAESEINAQRTKCNTGGACLSLKYSITSSSECSHLLSNPITPLLNCISLEKVPVSVDIIKSGDSRKIEIKQ